MVVLIRFKKNLLTNIYTVPLLQLQSGNCYDRGNGHGNSNRNGHGNDHGNGNVDSNDHVQIKLPIWWFLEKYTYQILVPRNIQLFWLL